ncbi:MAG: acetate--CoA ligase family protein [Thermodesulfobacteriota bacterium]|nr:acetate--CoA ligase family protein [Thermodesulfobacteriota bacterium]
MMMDSDLTPMLSPKSVAVIGASPEAGSVGGLVLNYLIKFGYQGKIYPVNPKYGDLQGIRCYPSIKEIPEAADTVLVSIAAKYVIPAIQDCAARGIKTAIIATAGFAELGGEGKKLQEELHQVIRQQGMRVCGPNCNGIVNFYENATLCFSRFMEGDKIHQGNIGFITQSGAMGGSFIDRCQDRNMGFTYYLAPGNEVDVDVVDFMSFLVEDENTKVITAYVEQIRDAQKFLQVARRAVEKEKPIIILKVGVTQAGAKAAASHTGALAGSHRVYEAAFRQNGVISVEDFDHLLATAKLFSKSKLPRGNRVGVLSSSGGGSIMLADRCEKYGLEMPSLSDKTKEELGKLLPSFATIENPMDLTWGAFRGGPEAEQKMFKIFADDENLDIIVFMMTMVAGERARGRAISMVATAAHVDKPCVTWWAAGNLAGPGFRILDESSNILFKSPDRCVKALKAMLDYARFRNQHIGLQNVDQKITVRTGDRSRAQELLRGKAGLTEHQAKLILDCYEIPRVREAVAQSARQAAQIAEDLGYPVAMKISSPQIIHKTEAGGVRLNLTKKTEVKDTYRELLRRGESYNPDALIEGVLIQEMVNGGVEIIIGMSKDPTFGPTIMLGLGGIFVEILKDVSLRVLPVTQKDAEEMIREIKGYEVLKGARGKPKMDLKAITDILLKVSALSMDLGDSISEIDLNPVIILPEGRGAKVVDAMIVRRTDPTSES